MSIYVDFHVLQTLPPNCVNRDDTGSPKTAIYGGAVRARVSSQAWKHAMRSKFNELFTEEELGKRTKFVVQMIEKEILKINDTIDLDLCHTKAIMATELAGLSIKSKNGEPEKVDALFFISNKQAKALAELACSFELGNKKASKEAEKEFKKALKDNPSVDIALFGRMAASDPTLNYDAAAQVAHAISTHAIQNEYDYFTTVDDLQVEDNAGAGHLGTVEFNSSTLYRYATVNASELQTTLGNSSVAEVIKKFGKSFICSMPTGKENTFANRTFPDTVYITIRNDQPVNLSGAFEIPVKQSNNGGYAVESEKKLSEYATKVYSLYAAEPLEAFCIDNGFGEKTITLPLPQLLDTLEKSIENYL